LRFYVEGLGLELLRQRKRADGASSAVLKAWARAQPGQSSLRPANKSVESVARPAVADLQELLHENSPVRQWDTAVRDYFPLLRWMIFTGVTVFGSALAWYYGLFQLMMAQDRSGLCGRMGSSLAIACCCRSRIAASSSSCCLDPEAAVIHLSFRTSGSQKTHRWRG
jgi:hypothetical protein